MGLFELTTLALAAGVTASASYGAPPAPSAPAGGVTTAVLTVTSLVKDGPQVPATALSFSLPSGLSSWAPSPWPEASSTPVVTVPVGPLPSETASHWVDLSSFAPDHPHNVTSVAPPTTILPSVVNTTLVVSTTANSTGFNYGTPTGSAVATKTTGPDSGVDSVQVGVMAGLVGLAVAVLGA